VLFILVLSSLWLPTAVQAQSSPSCSFQPDGSIVCIMSGSAPGDEAGNGNGNTASGGACTPGEHVVYQIASYDPETGRCNAYPASVDNCTGQVVSSVESALFVIPCELQSNRPPQHPCTIFSVGSGGITCTNTEWDVRARVTFPEIYLDVRPYPVTLVRWPTAVRNGGQPESSGSGHKDYIANGGGSENNPAVGDWRDLRLTLTLRPAGPMFVSLPHIGDLMLSNVGANGNPMPIRWEVPSHPEVGGGPLAGSIPGLDELPADIPVFVGSGRAPYQLFWELRYFEYEAIRECVTGPNANGNYNCGNGTGHREVVGYEWQRHSTGGEIPPTAVQNTPASVMADLNNDGTPDAYWDRNLTMRRMNDANSVVDPLYQQSWNWGGTIYWAVREGQGQIGWPSE
jgi:hypothetical protein